MIISKHGKAREMPGPVNWRPQDPLCAKGAPGTPETEAKGHMGTLSLSSRGYGFKVSHRGRACQEWKSEKTQRGGEGALAPGTLPPQAQRRRAVATRPGPALRLPPSWTQRVTAVASAPRSGTPQGQANGSM